jgi:multicomponent K+:H+ antiporter subunit E
MRIRTRVSRRYPPLLVGSLIAMWLLLNQSLAPGHILLGTVLALAVSWASAVLRPLQPHIRKPWLAIVLGFTVLADIVRSNIGVARIVLGLVRDREIRSGFVRIPLTLEDPHGLAVLATIVTSTPGTVWVNLDVQEKILTLHVLDLRNEQDWIDWIKNRYEPLLLGIFE